MTDAGATSGAALKPPAGAASTARSSAAPWWLIPAAVAVPFVAVFHHWFWRQWRFSTEYPEDWGHALLVPLVSVWLAWRNRETIARIVPRTYWPGLVPLVAGLVYYTICVVIVRNHMLQGFSLILTLFGLILLLGGPRLSRATFIPLLYLFFMVRISQEIMLRVTFRLQAIAAEGAEIMLRALMPLFGRTTELVGNTIHLVHDKTGEFIPLNVAEACSGMRMVIAFFALATAVALGGFPGVDVPRWWQRIAVFLLAGPVAVLMNMIRVAVLGLASLVDPGFAEGGAHTLIGWVLLFPSLLAFLGIVELLKRIETPGPSQPA